jgi:hypothetical protein
MRLIGWLILAALLECLILFAWLIPTPHAADIVMAQGIIGGWIGPPVLIERNMQAFGLYLALPLTIIAVWLIGCGDDDGDS